MLFSALFWLHLSLHCVYMCPFLLLRGIFARWYSTWPWLLLCSCTLMFLVTYDPNLHTLHVNNRIHYIFLENVITHLSWSLFMQIYSRIYLGTEGISTTWPETVLGTCLTNCLWLLSSLLGINNNNKYHLQGLKSDVPEGGSFSVSTRFQNPRLSMRELFPIGSLATNSSSS